MRGMAVGCDVELQVPPAEQGVAGEVGDQARGQRVDVPATSIRGSIDHLAAAFDPAGRSGVDARRDGLAGHGDQLDLELAVAPVRTFAASARTRRSTLSLCPSRSRKPLAAVQGNRRLVGHLVVGGPHDRMPWFSWPSRQGQVAGNGGHSGGLGQTQNAMRQVRWAVIGVGHRAAQFQGLARRRFRLRRGDRQIAVAAMKPLKRTGFLPSALQRQREVFGAERRPAQSAARRRVVGPLSTQHARRVRSRSASIAGNFPLLHVAHQDHAGPLAPRLPARVNARRALRGPQP